MSTKQTECSVIVRKRGRPAGKNRVPLSMEERRARNSEYERLRRVATRDALADLAAAAGLSADLTVPDLLANVIMFVQEASKADDSWDADKLRMCNDNLASQITMLEHRLATEPDPRTTDPAGSAALQHPLPNPLPVKRKMEDWEGPSPPSKRFSSDLGLNTRSGQAGQQPWSPSEFKFHPGPAWVPQSHSSWQVPESFPLTRHADQLSSAFHSGASSAGTESTFSVPAPSTSESCCDWTDEDLAAVWTDAVYAANVSGPGGCLDK